MKCIILYLILAIAAEGCGGIIVYLDLNKSINLPCIGKFVEQPEPADGKADPA